MTTILTQAWQEELDALVPEMITLRRHLHAHPELSFEEYKTSQFIYDYVTSLPAVEVVRPTETSVLVRIIGGKPGRKIGLRADIDALPIEEERVDIPFKSLTPGVMHACGHDGHAAILMTTTKFLAKHADELEGEIYAIFQHAEEKLPGGAGQIVATGLLDELDFIYGHHLVSMLPTGQIDIKPGPNTANADTYKITIFGKGGHAADPYNSLDPVVIAAEIVQACQTLVARFTDPFEPIVLSNTVLQAGNIAAVNVIPDTAVLGGSVRTTTSASRELVQKQLELIVKGICSIYGAAYQIEYIIGCDAVQNDELTTKIIKQIGEAMFPGEIVANKPLLVGEDFSAYNAVAPSTYIFIGAGNADQELDYPHHHPKFGLDETSFIKGLKMFVAVAANYNSHNLN